MSRKKSPQVTPSGKKPKRRLRKLLFLAALGGVGAAVSKKLGGSAGPVPATPPPAPRPTPTAAPTPPPAPVTPDAEAPGEATPDVEPVETPEAEAPAEPTTPEIPADSLTSFFDEVLTEEQEQKRARKR